MHRAHSNLSSKERGIEGENRACNFFNENGYTVVARNWRDVRGEIDIIAVKGDLLIFAEVKTLENSTAETLEIVLGKIKQKKIVETAKRFLQINRQYIHSYIRFDVLAIDVPGLPPVYHIEDAFSECI